VTGPNPSSALCARVADVAPGTPIPPEVGVVYCGGCGAELYAAASTRELVRAGVCRAVCRNCLPQGPLIPVMSEAQARELNDILTDD
jgi:hypothetical protein